MNRKCFVLAVIALVLGLLPGSAMPAIAQASTVNTETIIPIGFAPLSAQACTDNSFPPLGENIILSGNVHIVTEVTITSNGTKIVFEGQPQGVTGIGSVSGATYQLAAAVNHQVISTNVNGAPFGFDSLIVWDLIGRGQVTNMNALIQAHTVVNPNGTTTVQILRTWISCKQA